MGTSYTYLGIQLMGSRFGLRQARLGSVKLWIFFVLDRQCFQIHFQYISVSLIAAYAATHDSL